MQKDFDAIVVGAGFGGIYMCKKLIDQGLSVEHSIGGLCARKQNVIKHVE